MLSSVMYIYKLKHVIESYTRVYIRHIQSHT